MIENNIKLKSDTEEYVYGIILLYYDLLCDHC